VTQATRHLIVVLGDQLNADASAFDGFDSARDVVMMAEVAAESEHVWSAKPRTALFLAAMRHFRDGLRARGLTVRYTELDANDNAQTLAGELQRALTTLRPQRVILTEPGDWRTREDLKVAAQACGATLDLRDDRHFLCSTAEFRAHAAGRKQLRMEYFYREVRRRHRVLVDAQGEPVGGQWNFDHDNRGSFGRSGPPVQRAPVTFRPDATTREVLALVQRRFAGHPGSLEAFDWPVTPAEARVALDDFIAHRLSSFGEYQDAM